MSQTISVISSPAPIRYEDYSPYRHTRELIRRRVPLSRTKFKYSPSEELWINRAMAKLGYVNREKFLKQLALWTNLDTWVPAAFLSLIDLSQLDLQDAIEKDKVEFRCILSAIESDQLGPRRFAYRIIPAVYGGGLFQGELSEEEAITEAQNRIPLYRDFVIDYPNVKQIFVHEGKVDYEQLFHPNAAILEGKLFTAETGDKLGQSTLR